MLRPDERGGVLDMQVFQSEAVPCSGFCNCSVLRTLAVSILFSGLFFFHSVRTSFARSGGILYATDQSSSGEGPRLRFCPVLDALPR